LKIGGIANNDELSRIAQIWILSCAFIVSVFVIVCAFFYVTARDTLMHVLTKADFLYQKEHAFKVGKPQIIRASAWGGMVSIPSILASLCLTAYLFHSGFVDDFIIQQSILVGTTGFSVADSIPTQIDVHFFGVDSLSKCSSSCDLGLHSFDGRCSNCCCKVHSVSYL
jgi:hypothetical protein